MTRHGDESPLTKPAKRLLSLIYMSVSEGTLNGRKKMMKLGFLAEHLDVERDRLDTLQHLNSFDFIIYKYGPFSRELLDSFDTLRDEGLIEEHITEYEHKIRLTATGSEVAREIYDQLDEGVRQQIEQISDEYSDEGGSDLERMSLELLGISKEEKSEYQGQHVDVVITEGPPDSPELA